MCSTVRPKRLGASQAGSFLLILDCGSTVLSSTFVFVEARPLSMAQRRIYRNPPIVEAVCEFRFVTDLDEWDLTFPGKLHSELREAYPGKPRSQEIFHTEFPGQRREGSSLASRTEIRVQFTTEDGQKLVSFGPDVLSVNGLAPYEGWEEFEPRIQEAFEVYVGVVKPSAIRRIGVRYINKIGIPASRNDHLPRTKLTKPLDQAGTQKTCAAGYKDSLCR